MMDVEQLEEWRAADALFDQWLDQAEPDREAWLAAQDMPDPVRRRLLQLVRAHERTGNALDSAAGDLAGRSLGDWTLESELGRGGMAVVYLARREQGMASQRAAVKVLTLAALGAGGRERFQREAGILARLGHPNITRLIDSGVADDGTCWLAMPLVEGERIDHWCQGRGLDARAIVQLYLQVCAAVAYAHRNLVIHRDLKPSNVLVDTDGNVHLLDFGIGQFADVPAERTRTQWRALTPGYAAPEQLRGELPTTAIDVYGLGALLHRLLTGRAPGAPTGNGDTTRPSLLVRSAEDAYHRHYVPLKNDLDLVLLKALAEEPERRYPSVEAMALDLRRWLDGEPVQAEKPRLGYRARKFVARNKAGVAASVLVAASLAAGVGATLWQAGEARREAENARSQAQRAVLVRNFLEHVFTSTEPTAGTVPDALDLLEEGARRARAEVMHTDPLAAADILMLTGKARLELNRIGDGRADLETANDLFDASGVAYAERSSIKGELSSVLRYQGETELAVREAQEAVELGQLALAETGDAAPLIEARIRYAEAAFASDPAAATELLRQVVDSLPGHGLEYGELHRSALSSLSVTASVSDPADHAGHVELADSLIALSRQIDGAESGMHAAVLANQAQTFLEAGEYGRAEQLASAAVDLVGRIYDEPHTRIGLANCSLGVVLHTKGRPHEAVRYFSEADRVHDALASGDLSAESCYRNSGYAHLVTGNHEAALAKLARSWDILADHDWQSSVNGLVSCGFMATALLHVNDVEGARETLSGCPIEQTSPDVPLGRLQADVELQYALGDLERAARLASEARREAPPGMRNPTWVRPWMLSLLLAHEMRDAELFVALSRELAEFRETTPLSQCLAAPGETTCLALP